MMTDWKAGDLALCVANALPPPRHKPTKLLRIGAVYTVSSVRWSRSEQCVAIGLVEVKSKGPLGDWHACVFRKLDPHTEDEDDREVIAHMIYAPVSHDVKQAFAAEKGE